MGSATRLDGTGCRRCQSCKNRCNFSEVIDLKGIKIYKHESSVESVVHEELVASKDEVNSISYILHNTRGNAIHSDDIQSPLDEANISCPRCRAILQHAQKLLTRIPSIGKSVVIGICDHCKTQQSLIKTCKKCARVIREFLDSREVDYLAKEKTITPWLSTMQKALQNELVKSAAKAPHESRFSRGEPNDLAHKMLIDQRKAFDPAETPRDGHIKLTCTPCENRFIGPMTDLDKSPFMDFEFLKRKLEKTKPDFTKFAKQHKVSIQEPTAEQLSKQEKWSSLHHSDESLVSVAIGKTLQEKGMEATTVRSAPRKSSLKKHEKPRFSLQASLYHSDEYYFNESSNEFQYIFPGVQEKKEPQQQISSSELIKKTLERFKENKVQQEETCLKELQARKEKQLAAEESQKRDQQSVKDRWETSTSDISREEKSSLDRKEIIADGYVPEFGEKEIEKALGVHEERIKDTLHTGRMGRKRGKEEISEKLEKGAKEERDGKFHKGERSGKYKQSLKEKTEKEEKFNRGGKEISKNFEKGAKEERDGKNVKGERSGQVEKSLKEKTGKAGKINRSYEKEQKKDRTGGTQEKTEEGTIATARKRGKDGTSETAEKGNKDGTRRKGRKEGKDWNNETGGKDGTMGTERKKGKYETSRTAVKEITDDTRGKRAKHETTGPEIKGGKHGKRRTEEKGDNELTGGTDTKGGKGRTGAIKPNTSTDGTGRIGGKKEGKREEGSGKETKANQVDSKVPPKSKNELSREESQLRAKEGETDKALTKSEKEDALKRKQEYDKRVREMERDLKENEPKDDSGNHKLVHKKPDKTETKLKEESASRKKPTSKETRERSELQRKENLEKKLKEYGNAKAKPHLRVVTAKDKKEIAERESRLTESQQQLALKRQTEDLYLMRQLEERRKAKAHQIPKTSPATKRQKQLYSSTQIVEIEHEEEKESEDEFEDYLDNFNRNRYKPIEIIVDTNVYKYTKELEAHLADKEVAPILYKMETGGDIAKDLPPDVVPAEMSKRKTQEGQDRRGVTSYALSDRTFIEKGWTMLPTEKVLRKMNIYSMSPAQPQFDWFEHNRSKGTMYYGNGDRLAEFEDNKTARWYYRNGRPALEYYEAQELNANQRFVVYSSGEPDDSGRNYPITILATFDYLGNGIVFDHTGKIRLKYNQTEGVVLDRKLGPVTKWKWHSLNDPPSLQQVMIDNELPVKDEKIMKLGSPSEDHGRPANEQMLVIEYDNYIREKNKKVTKKFKPFQIKMKALKVNENFSLRVLDQANVTLHFRDGTTSMKLNLGMKLNNKEIVDSDTVEVGFVANPLQKLPAKSDSLAKMQLCLSQNQQVERARVEHDLRIRPVLPVANVDLMRSAVSRKLRSPFPQGSSVCTETITDTEGNSQHHCREACVCNVFYSNQLL